MKRFSKYIFTLLPLFIIMAILNILIAFIVIIKNPTEASKIPAQTVSEGLYPIGNDYKLDETLDKKLKDKNCFLLLLDDDGNAKWSYNLPEDIPTKYSTSDIIRFTRWYLNDHPIYTYIRDDGILVYGLPQNSIWKYNIEFSIDMLNDMVTASPYIIILNIAVIIILPLVITDKLSKKRERQRTEWIAGVSHDIRTPLSIVMGHAEQGSIIEKQCLRIKDLVGNLNTENKLESGTGVWNKSKINLPALIRDSLCNFMNSEGENFSFEADFEQGIDNTMIIADESLILRLVDNLISNSVRHNPDGCIVKASLNRLTDKKILLTISDNGQGVNSQKLKLLNTGLKKNYLPEHGLGIRVVKQIAKKYGYKVLFKSIEGHGFSCEIIMRCIYPK